jgi:hypothetical protein
MALDIENFVALGEYLENQGHATQSAKPTFRLMSGGVSNRVVLAVFPDGREWVLKQALEKLRVSVDWFSSPERIHREAMALSWFAKLLPPENITQFVFEDRAAHVLAMDAVPSPHENWRSLLLDGRVEALHFEDAGKLLGTIHRRGAEQPAEVRALFEDRSYFFSLRTEPYYLFTAQAVPEFAEFFAALVRDCEAIRLTLVHGDFSPKNVLIYNNNLVLLDHEVVHLGDPAFDLGFFFALLLSKANHLPEHRNKLFQGLLSALEGYRFALGDTKWWRDIEGRAVRHTLGCLLARVEGRSQLEYLDKKERSRQRAVALSFLRNVPATIHELVSEFDKRL